MVYLSIASSMRYQYDRRASKDIVLRENYISEYSGQVRDAFAPTYDDFTRLTRSGHYYRGVSEAEWKYIQAHGHIKSNTTYCVPGEGTCFGKDIATAEGYTNFGHTDPRKTGKPNYLIEVSTDALKEDRRDGYWKTLDDDASVPKSAITRVWKMDAEGDKLVAHQIS